MPLDQVAANMEVQKSICMGAPFYVLGPLVTDIAPGYDHITAAIGGAVAAMSGAAFLCYVTPAEHLALPNVEDVKQGIIASKIAAHAADIAKGVPGARDIDDRMADARRKLYWDAQFACALDPEPLPWNILTFFNMDFIWDGSIKTPSRFKFMYSFFVYYFLSFFGDKII